MKLTKKIKILIICASLLMLIIPSLAHQTDNQTNSSRSNVVDDNARQKTIYLDTGGKTGYLVYMEEYYVTDKNNTNNLTIDQTRIYFSSTINNSKMRIRILRPLDESGKPYPDSNIRAIATVDNDTVLDAWYANRVLNPNPNMNNEPQLQHPELFISMIVGIFIVIIAIIVVIRKKRRSNK